jgi:hypothetical protein
LTGGDFFEEIGPEPLKAPCGIFENSVMWRYMYEASFRHDQTLLIILDGVPYRNWRRLFGNLEGWVEQGEAQVRRMRSVLPSTSASCYASIHTGVPPQQHHIWDNAGIRRLDFPDVFSELTEGGQDHRGGDAQLLVRVLQPRALRCGARHRI